MPKQISVEDVATKVAPARWPGCFDRSTFGEYIGVSLRSIDKISSSELPPDFRLGDAPRWRRESIDRWLEKKTNE